MTQETEIQELKNRIALLESQMALLKPWLTVMYADMMKLQFAAAKAMKGDRDGANAIFREVQKNADLLAAGENE